MSSDLRKWLECVACCARPGVGTGVEIQRVRIAGGERQHDANVGVILPGERRGIRDAPKIAARRQQQC